MPADRSGDADRTARIRALNDTLRTRGTGGRILVTRSTQSLGEAGVARILNAVRLFDGFTPDNDPYGEHDFGSLDVGGKRVFFKIDYYDPTETYGSEDPADETKTRRVLTIMLADEY